MNVWLSFLIDSLAFGATFIYGSTGEILTEKAGHLNLGIPGIMCMGGAGGVVMLNLIGKSGLPPVLIVVLGILSSLVFSMLMGLIYSFLTVTMRANQNVTGLALTTFGVGLMKVIMSKMDATVYLVGPKMLYRWPFADRQDSLQCLGVLFFLAVIIALTAGWVLQHTKVGLHLCAVGENPATADAVGINVTGYKYGATCIGSGIAGLGGFYYIIDYMASQEAYLSLEAFGWLSIALVIFALWRPHMTIIGSTVFGFLFSCSSYITNIDWIQVTMAAKPLLKMLPYVVTIVVLVISSIRNKRENQPPSSLGMAYFREER
ncbi:MAG: ABC transporter permease [Clostridiales bacterium]|nr:ABC transporter permease [Clostridiales bacterium]